MRRFIVRFIASVFFFACIWAAGFAWFLVQVPSSPSTDARVADAVVVLTGGAGRVNLGLQRVKEGKAKQVFISGVNDEATAEHVIRSAIAYDAPEFLAENGEQLALGYQATSTIGNADEVKKWVSEHQIKTIRLVTANYHMPRSMLEFRRVMPETLDIIPDPVFPGGFERGDWWRGGNSSRLLLNEFHKLCAAYLRHALIAWHKKR